MQRLVSKTNKIQTFVSKTNKVQKLVSNIDKSVNFVENFKGSKIESRYVRRRPDYISAYLSSHNGCNMGCKFCWLTASGQTKFNHVSNEQYAGQLNNVLKHAKTVDGDSSKDVRVNINMMSRGEPLGNKYLVNSYDEFYNSLQYIIDKYDYKEQKVNVSTIMPFTIKHKELIDIFGDDPAYMYYSLYSTNERFRKEWIKNGIHWSDALGKLRRYQDATGLPVTLHFCIIEGENDKLCEVYKMAEEINKFNFEKLKFNIVKFNPHPSMSQYTEANQAHIDEIFKVLKETSVDMDIHTNKTRIVPRAGPDVFASCGMFTS